MQYRNNYSSQEECGKCFENLLQYCDIYRIYVKNIGYFRYFWYFIENIPSLTSNASDHTQSQRWHFAEMEIVRQDLLDKFNIPKRLALHNAGIFLSALHHTDANWIRINVLLPADSTLARNYWRRQLRQSNAAAAAIAVVVDWMQATKRHASCAWCLMSSMFRYYNSIWYNCTRLSIQFIFNQPKHSLHYTIHGGESKFDS